MVLIFHQKKLSSQWEPISLIKIFSEGNRLRKLSRQRRRGKKIDTILFSVKNHNFLIRISGQYIIFFPLGIITKYFIADVKDQFFKKNIYIGEFNAFLSVEKSVK